MRRKLTIGLVSFLSVFNAYGSDVFYNAPKLSLRTTNGLLLNSGTQGGSSINIGGINASFNYFFTQNIAAGIAYDIAFDYSAGSIPLAGPDLGVRYYFLGSGTRTRIQYSTGSSENIDKLGFYGGTSLSYRTYFLGSNTSSSTISELTGNFYTINLLAGGDYRLSSHFELTGEANFSLLTFASSDDRIQIRSLSLLLGLSYIW